MGSVERFRKKPVVIDAMQFFNDGSSYDLLHWINEGQHAAGREFATWQNNTIMVPTLEGQHIASPGDWIIRGVQGEFYPCKPDIFAETYEPEDAAALREQPEARGVVDDDDGLPVGFAGWYNRTFRTRGADTKHLNDCEEAWRAALTGERNG